MTPKDRRYTYWIFRVFITAVYLFLFAAQVNSKYYTIANFYVYGAGVDVSHGKFGKDAFVISRENRPVNRHLSVDKRFFGKSLIYTTCDDLVTLPLCHDEAVYTQHIISHLPAVYEGRNKFLRGPPSGAYSI
jgi:hypothetical protein